MCMGSGGIGAAYLAGNAFTSDFKTTQLSGTSSSPANETLTEAPKFIASLINSVTGLTSYITQIVNVVTNFLSNGNEIVVIFTKFEAIINRELSDLRSQLNSILTVTDVLLENVTNNLNSMSSNATELQQRSKRLTSDQTALQAALATIVNNASAVISGCTANNCSALQDNLNHLKTPAPYSFPDLTSALDRVSSVNNKLSGLNLNLQLPNSTSNETQSLSESINATLSSVRNLLTSFNISQMFDLRKLLKPAENVLSIISLQVGDNGSKYYMILICTAPVVVLLFSVICLIIGTFVHPTKKKRKICSRATAENFSTMSAGSAFTLSSVVMLVVVVMFIIGSLLYVELCRDAVNEDKTIFAKIDTIVNKIASSGSTLLPDYINLTNFSLQQIFYVQCKRNDSFLDILLGLVNFQQFLTKFLNQQNIINNTLNDMVNAGAANDLDNLMSSLTSLFNLTQFNFTLQQNVTGADLKLVAGQMDELAAANSTWFGGLAGQANYLRQLQNTTVFNMTSNINAMNLLVSSLQHGSDSLVAVGNQLSANIRQLQTNLSSMVQALSSRLSADATSLIEHELQSISNATRCRPLYDFLSGVFTAICVDFLNPFNALWFAFAWIVVLFIPHIVFGVWLGGLFARKPAESSPTEDGQPEPAPANDKKRKQDVPMKSRQKTKDRQPIIDNQQDSQPPDTSQPQPAAADINPYRQFQTPMPPRYPPARPPPLPYRPPYMSPYARLSPYRMSPFNPYSRHIPPPAYNGVPLRSRYQGLVSPLGYQPYGRLPPRSAGIYGRPNMYLPRQMPSPPHY